MAFLDDFPPRRSQFRYPRRAEPSGVVVVHSAENTPDFVAYDGGAEAVANFIRNRPDAGSYHDLVDSDSTINVVRYDCEAYHDGTGSNPHSYGVSVATRADVWPLAPPAWRDGAVCQAAAAAARYATWLRARNGIVIPARRITRAQSDARVPGFLSHAERDPARRTDPGPGFPWNAFLAEFARLTTTPDTPTTEDDDMAAPARVIYVPNDPDGRDVFMAVGEGYVEKFHGDTPDAHKLAAERYKVGVKVGLLRPAEPVTARDYDVAADLARRLAPR